MDLERLTEDVKALAVETGRFLRKERVVFNRERVERKSAHDYVSYVDKESERRIIARLRELLPEAGFVAEEGSGTFDREEYCWVVDPLDGTSNYIHDNAPYCVSIALRNHEEILLGVVYECSRDELFWARRGGKAFMNGNEIHVSGQPLLDQSFIELGFPYRAETFRRFIVNTINDLYGHVGGLRLLGAAAVEICYVAAGRFEARIEGLIQEWDVAAASLILRQAGGRMTDFSGNENLWDGHEVFASNGKIHDELLGILKKHKNLIGN